MNTLSTHRHMKPIKSQVQKTLRKPLRRRIIIKLLQTSDKEKVLKAGRKQDI